MVRNGAALGRVVVLQPEGMVDHIRVCDEDAYYSYVEDQGKAAKRCSNKHEVLSTLARIGEFVTKAGGAAANSAKALSACFGLSVALVSGEAWLPAHESRSEPGCSQGGIRAVQVGSRGTDEWGEMYSISLERSNVDTRHLRIMEGSTGALHVHRRTAFLHYTVQEWNNGNGCSGSKCMKHTPASAAAAAAGRRWPAPSSSSSGRDTGRQARQPTGRA